MRESRPRFLALGEDATRCERGNREDGASANGRGDDQHDHASGRVTTGSDCWLCFITRVGVEADCGVETLAVLQDVQGEENFWALSLLLYAVQRTLQV